MARQTISRVLRTLADFSEPWREFWRMSIDDGFLITAIAVLYRYIPESLFHARGFIIVADEPHESPVDQSGNREVRPATLDDLDLLSNCDYPESILRHWFEGGARPLIYPWLALPIGLTFKPLPELAIDVETGFSVSGFLTNLGIRYGI